MVSFFLGEGIAATGDINQAGKRLEYPYPNTTVKQDIFRLGYELKPADSRWLDLEANLWRTDSKSSRYQTGDVTYGVTGHDMAWNQWVRCNHDMTIVGTMWYPFLCPGMVPGGPAPERQPNIDGRYDIRIGTRIDSHATRTGFDLSNRFRLTDRLNLTAAADWQYEQVRDNMPVTDIAVLLNGSLAQAYGPASGRRQEYGGSFNLEWQATDRLQLSAGVRYGTYWSFDDETDQQRRDRNENWKIGSKR